MRTLKIYSFGNFQVCNRVLLTVITKELMGGSPYWLWGPSAYLPALCSTLQMPAASAALNDKLCLLSSLLRFHCTTPQSEYWAQVKSQGLSQVSILMLPDGQCPKTIASYILPSLIVDYSRRASLVPATLT